MGAVGSSTISNLVFRFRRTKNGELPHVTLWKANRSPACRAVMMALDAMDLSLSEVDIDLDKGGHKSEEMTQRNPLQTLPVLQDRKLFLSDSHSICTYLVHRYCNNGKLIPYSVGGAAKVHQMMHFNSGVLYPRYRMAVDPILFGGCQCVMDHHVSNIECAYSCLETMLDTHVFFGGAAANLSDITIGATVSTLHLLVPIDKERFPKLSAWLYRLCDEKFFLTGSKDGLHEFKNRVDNGISDESRALCAITSARRRAIAMQATQIKVHFL